MNLPILLTVRSCSHKCMYWYMYYIYECLRDKNSIPVSQFSSLFWSKIVFSNSVNHQNISFIIILNRTDIYVIYIVFLKKKWLHLQTHFSLSFSLNILINWYNLSNSNNKKELYFCSTSWLSLNQYQYSIFHSFFFSLSVISLYYSSIFCNVINSYTSLFPVFVLLTSFFYGTWNNTALSHNNEMTPLSKPSNDSHLLNQSVSMFPWKQKLSPDHQLQLTIVGKKEEWPFFKT